MKIARRIVFRGMLCSGSIASEVGCMLLLHRAISSRGGSVGSSWIAFSTMSELAEVICGEQERFTRLGMKEMEQHKLPNCAGH